ncbi:MAG TPA: NTP transferase domain-containing protein [Candidatus Baltobacteraceae bacterium]|nr:NTP transferase domain-containing protein [Candidatus Baltobacteraceae bacterium]
MKAVVTAGGRITGEYAREAGTNVKALARVRGTTMIDRAVDALRGAGATRIAVVGGEEVRAACGDRVELIVDEAKSGTENLVRALRAWPDDGDPLIYATSDMPYVDAESVGEFLQRVPPGNVALPLAEFTDFDARFPGAPPCGITLAGECVVNGDVFYIPGGLAARVEAVARHFFEARKNPWQMARLVSPRILVRFLFRRLGIGHIETHAHRVLGVPAMAIRRCRPELAFDADTVDDYRYVSAHE